MVERRPCSAFSLLAELDGTRAPRAVRRLSKVAIGTTGVTSTDRVARALDLPPVGVDNR